MTAKRFEDLEVWQLSRSLTKEIYRWTKGDMLQHDWSFRDQIRRSSVSVMSNIAEGFESRTQAQFIQFLGLAKGSVGEVRAQLYVGLDAEYLTVDEQQVMSTTAFRISAMLYALIQYLETSQKARRVSETGAEYTLPDTE